METRAAHLVDVLLITALTEEQQVVEQVLQLRASYRGPAGQPPERVNVYAYPADAARPFLIATASIHQMGAVPMAAKAPRLFNAIRPESAVLLGISATTVPGTIDLGDVPVASQVIEYDDIAAAPGELSFRTEGFQVDPRLRDAAGALRADFDRYSSWQDDCLAVIADLMTRLNGARATQIKIPANVRRPHLLVGIGAGGPFLIRDPAFRSKVQSLHPKLTWVEMESHGFMRAAREHLVEAIVVKGISDAGDTDKEALEKTTGGFYRAFACSNSTLAVLHLLDQAPWQPRAFDERAHARALLDRARKESLSGNFEAACKIAETCFIEARRLGERELECTARVFQIRCTVQVPGDVAARAARARESRDQLAELRSLGASEHVRMLLAAEIALSERDGEKALEAADAVINGSETDPGRFDGLLVKLQALQILDRAHDALSLDLQITRVLSGLPESMAADALCLRVAWLRIRCLVDVLGREEIATFTDEVHGLVAREAVDRRMAAIIIGDLARILERCNKWNDLVFVLRSAYDVISTVENSARLAEAATEIAEVALATGERDVVAQYIGLAESWLARCSPPQTEVAWMERMAARLEFARGRRLMTPALPTNEEHREDLEQALEVFTGVLANLRGPGGKPRADMVLLSAEIASWAGRAAARLGRMASAAALFRQSRPDAGLADPGFAAGVAYPAWLGEAQALLLSGEVKQSLDATRMLCAHRGAPNDVIAQAHELEGHVTRVVVPFVEWFRSADATTIADRGRAGGVRAAVADQMRPLISLWNRWRGTEDAQAGILDFWGRGAFARVAAAVRTSPHSVIAVDATSIEEIRRWSRMLCPLFETVAVKWKGEIGADVVTVPCQKSFACDGELNFGGHGYWWTSGELRGAPDWVVVQSWANPVSSELASFLAGEALPLLAAGRLVVLPAPLVGCTQSAVGWTDDLFLKLLGGVVNVVNRADAAPRAQILDLATTNIPFLDGVRLGDLPAVLDETEQWIPDLRKMIWTGRRGEDAEETWRTAISMESDIRSAFRQLNERLQKLAAGGGGREWRVAHVDGALSAGRSGTRGSTGEAASDLLRSVVSETGAAAPWIPYWRLMGMGGRLHWSSPLDNPSVVPPNNLPENAPREAVHREVQSWLCEGTTRGLHTVFVR